MDKAFDEFLLSKENIEYKKLLGKRKGYGPNATVPGLSSFQQKLFNIKFDKARKKYNDKVYSLGKSFFGEMPRNEINMNLMSAQDAINSIKNIDNFLFGKGYEKDLSRAKQKIFNKHFKVPQVTYVAKKYDNEYKDYLNKLAKNGYQKALNEVPNFLAGLNVHKGNVTYKAVADVFGHTYVSPNEVIL